jgi:stage II sporulation protein P
MRTEHDIFKIIKNSPELTPREEFVHKTKTKLRRKARIMEYKGKLGKVAYISLILAASFMLIVWFRFYNGINIIQDNITASLSESEQNKTIYNKNKLVLIYHTHNHESFLPMLGNKNGSMTVAQAFHPEKNITMVGEHLAKELSSRHINVIHDKTDVAEVLKERNLTFADSYKITREILEKVMRENKNLSMVFDIHRDSKSREQTTVNINGKNYGTITFIVASSSKKYKQNKEFALRLHETLEKKYPGISKGIVTKGPANISKEFYNQYIFPNLALVEIGGYENTLEEEYRTIEVLAEAIQEILNEN